MDYIAAKDTKYALKQDRVTIGRRNDAFFFSQIKG